MDMKSGKEVSIDRDTQAALERAEKITVADFSASLSAGILTAIEARRPKTSVGGIDFRPWIWAGWIIGDGPFGPGGGPFGGQGPLGPGGPGGGGGL